MTAWKRTASLSLIACVMSASAALAQQPQVDAYKVNPFLQPRPVPGAEPRQPNGQRAPEAVANTQATSQAISVAAA